MWNTMRTKTLAAAAALTMILALSASGNAWAAGSVTSGGGHDSNVASWLAWVYGSDLPISGTDDALRVLWFLGIIQP